MSKDENKDKIPVKEVSQGHRYNANKKKMGQYLCPECNKTFSSKERAEEHLHAEHSKHLISAHSEYHGEDRNQKHQGNVS